MSINTYLQPAEQYVVDETGKIRAADQTPAQQTTHIWADDIQRWEAEHVVALQLPVYSTVQEQIDSPDLSCAFPREPAVRIQQADWNDLRAKRHLNVEEGFLLATGIHIRKLVFRFWDYDDKPRGVYDRGPVPKVIFFNIRPDFGFLSLVSNLTERPLNPTEAAIHKQLGGYLNAILSIVRAIDAGELAPENLYPLEWWQKFWTDRGLSVLAVEAPAAATSAEGNFTVEDWHIERKRLLKQMGLMSLLLAEKSNKYKRGERPNASQIAKDVGEILQAVPEVSSKLGTGPSNIRGSIADGLELLFP